MTNSEPCNSMATMAAICSLRCKCLPTQTAISPWAPAHRDVLNFGHGQQRRLLRGEWLLGVMGMLLLVIQLPTKVLVGSYKLTGQLLSTNGLTIRLRRSIASLSRNQRL